MVLYQLVTMYVRKEQFMLIDLFKAFDQMESNNKSDIFSPKRSFFLHAHARCSELPIYVSTMFSFHGTYIRWKLRNRCVMLFDLFKAFDQTASNNKLDLFFSKKRLIFLYARARCSRLLCSLPLRYLLYFPLTEISDNFPPH